MNGFHLLLILRQQLVRPLVLLPCYVESEHTLRILIALKVDQKKFGSRSIRRSVRSGSIKLKGS